MSLYFHIKIANILLILALAIHCLSPSLHAPSYPNESVSASYESNLDLPPQTSHHHETTPSQHHHEHNASCDDCPISWDLKNHQVAILVFLNEWLLLTKFPTIPPHKLIRPPERLRL